MVQSTTTIFETAMVVGSTATTGSTAVKVKRDEDGEIKDVYLNKKRAIIGTSLSTTAVSATTAGQELSYQHTINNIRNAQEVVESLSDDELASFEAMLREKDLEFSADDQASVEPENTESKSLIKR